jgi:DNA-binding IscR family transcriptional regulator
MSTKHLALAADITGLPPTCKLLLFGLGHCATPDGNALVTTSELTRITGLSDRAIRANMNKLRKLGYVRTAEGTHNNHQISFPVQP